MTGGQRENIHVKRDMTGRTAAGTTIGVTKNMSDNKMEANMKNTNKLKDKVMAAQCQTCSSTSRATRPSRERHK